VNELLYNSLKKYFSDDVTYEKFINTYDGKTVGVLLSSKVGAAISADIKTNSFWAVIGSVFVVGLYLAFSFRKWQYALGATVAILHDVIFVLGLYSLLYK